ncbi:helix-turn-helix transcriptional regulator [Tuanshanicoccus lijuaniae]|uniref:helix-turn-helix domain-containing protein n=1 Tax=Aerococcaceae bacterium zg-1292 TaxID=2774330 RepID=UPI001937A16A|nr:helix-turn-helix transcriptional regulator [Aerococcaceae bacterium zg-1292]MBS4456995.1 helix-turn-helix transcriptional regulator [Aerococcaceae bacterium zg-A91]MBS4458740.1 helix-turn-helix transcriptional regulator [Aerococcaceae bacterium zg-BR33]QQA37520.1 helix-turn-helix transcriptional regulator [Aerococcaceae bacterium zg-1292]
MTKKNYKPEDIRLGLIIKSIRSELGLDQKQFANKINATVSALSNWENGRNKPNNNMLHQIAKLSNTTVSEIMNQVNLDYLKQEGNRQLGFAEYLGALGFNVEVEVIDNNATNNIIISNSELSAIFSDDEYSTFMNDIEKNINFNIWKQSNN